jgi:osmotically-inducible protein OsmY
MNKPAVSISFIFTLLLLLSTSQLTGCTAAVVGGVAVGTSVVHDRRSTGIVIDDQEIELRALQLWHDHSEISSRSNISATSYNLVVLLTGQAESAGVVTQYADLISRLPRVRKVHNEVVIGAERTFSESTNDTYLTSRAKLALFDVSLPDFDPSRIKVVTSQGTVYLMGLVTRQEAEAATDKVRFISGVKHVVKVFEYID